MEGSLVIELAGDSVEVEVNALSSQTHYGGQPSIFMENVRGQNKTESAGSRRVLYTHVRSSWMLRTLKMVVRWTTKRWRHDVSHTQA